MRLVMMGTGPFAVPTFRALFDTSHEIVALVTQPQRPARGKRNATVAPMREEALAHDLVPLDPDDINSPAAHAALRALRADLFIVADYGQILSRETLGLARLGGINLHGSLLPKYRGAAPINWALYRGETESGVSVIHMTPQLDAGPVLAQARTPIQPTENSLELERRLSDLGAPLICQVIEDLQHGTTSHISQDPAEATKARRLRKTDGQIDWSRSATAINNQVRALVPWPMCYTFWHRRQGEPLRLIIGRTSVVSQSTAAEPGTVMVSERNRLVVATGDPEQGLSLDKIQPAGKRMLSTEDFLRGYPVALGERMGPVDE